MNQILSEQVPDPFVSRNSSTNLIKNQLASNLDPVDGHNGEHADPEFVEGAVCISEESPPNEAVIAVNPLAFVSDKELENMADNFSDIEVKSNEQKQEDNDAGVAKKPNKVRKRRWTVVLSAVVACIPFILVGCTLGFPSGALLDLTDLEDRQEYKLTREQADLFGVSV